MLERRPALGKGLSALIPEVPEPARSGPVEVDIDLLAPNPQQPRLNMDDGRLEELAASIRSNGIIQPILVRRTGSTYRIVAGERRWRAAQRANLHEVPVIVRSLSDQEAIEIAIIENVQREDLNAIEEGEGYDTLMKSHGYTQEDLAKVIGKSRSHLANTLRLLKLPESVQDLVRNGDLSAGHARVLIGHPDAAALAVRIANERLTVRQVEAWAQEERAKPKRDKKASKDADTRAAESELRDALGLKVEIKPGRGERGELRIRYTSFDQFEDVRKRLLRGPGR